MSKRPPRTASSGRPLGAAAPPRSAQVVLAAVQAAMQRDDRSALSRLAREVLALARGAAPGDETLSDAVQALVLALARAAAYSELLTFARESAALLGYRRLAASELLPLLADGHVDAARELAATLADEPVEFGGHGLRAIVRTLLGRDDDAAADGAAFIGEAHEIGTSLAAWRSAARDYGPSTAHVLSRYGAMHRELETAFPGSRPWRGEPVAGRTVALQLVEGLGDNLEALRFAAAVRDEGGRVLLGCDPRLHGLVRASNLADVLMDRPLPPRHAYGGADYHLVVGGWLHDSGLPPSRWPSTPYVAVPDDEPAPTILDGLGSPRIGIVWAGNPEFALEPTRGLPYAALKRLVAATPNVSWVSLQHGEHPRANELRATPVTRRVIDAGPTLRSLRDTAVLLRHLDLLVTIDSAPAHLAGAMGLPVWTLLGRTFNWRWRIDGEQTPLYPSMRLVREGTAGDWTAAVDRVAADLAHGLAHADTPPVR